MVYKKLVLKDCKVVGSIMIGDLRDAQRSFRAIEMGLDICTKMDSLREWDLGFVPRAITGKG